MDRSHDKGQMITPMRVFVLLYNAGTENEGIHTIRVGDANKLLMFQSEDDAQRFALMLEAQDFPAPTVESIDAEEIKEFCAQAGFEWEIVPENGGLMIPPEVNVEQTDWQPDSPQQDTGKQTEAETQLDNSELDSIRRKLEGLL